MRAALLTATLVAAATSAQQTPPDKPASPPEPAPASTPTGEPTDPRAARLARDLTAVCDGIEQNGHTFRGTLTFTGEGADAPAQLDCTFVGGCDGDLSWYQIGEFRVVTHGDRVVVSRDQARWGRPQGDTPDVPLTPRLLARHLRQAELDTQRPADFHDRPALLVHARWRGQAAKDAVWATATPSSRHERMIQAIGAMAARNQDTCTVDAVVRYDPADKQWLATTMRLVILDGRPLGEDEEPIAAPDGLPPLHSRPIVQVQFTVERCEAEAAPMPALDEAARSLLGLPTRR